MYRLLSLHALGRIQAKDCDLPAYMIQDLNDASVKCFLAFKVD